MGGGGGGQEQGEGAGRGGGGGGGHEFHLQLLWMLNFGSVYNTFQKKYIIFHIISLLQN